MSNTTKTIDKICPDAGLWIFVVSKASGRSLPTTIQAVYIRIIRRIYTEIRYLYGNIYTIFPYIYVLYGVYIRRLKFTYGVYEYGYGEDLFIHTFIYTVRIYTAYIYLYGLGQPYILVMSRMLEEHEQHLRIVLQILRKNGFKAKLSK